MKTSPSINRLLGLAFAAAIGAGCANVKQPIYDGTPIPPGHSVKPVPATYTVSSEAEIIKISLAVDPADEKSADFASQIGETAFGALRARKYKVVTDGSEDILLGIRAGTTLYDNSADTYFTLDGTAALRLSDAVNGRVLAEETIRGRNKASLGMEKAVRDVAAAMKPAIEKWIGEKVVPGQIPLEARTLRISHIDRYAGDESVFIERFVKAISAMDGVLRCETEARDGAAKEASFRVLYRRENYPQGFIHAVINQNPEFNLVLQ